MGELSDCRSQTSDRFAQLRAELHSESADLVDGKACVYATGSFGRWEASAHSDLDLFILGKSDNSERGNGDERSLLRPLDEICLKANLIYVTRRCNIPPFSGEGRYLTHYSLHELTKTLGTPEDDVTNTFTARLLLLLESKPLLEDEVYKDVLEKVIAAYWKDFEDHKTDFMPAFLANDILRLWRTFCVNYEARTRNISMDAKIKRKIKNYKLKHSRLLTCYSAILYMLFVYIKHKTVSPLDIVSMTRLTPTQRLEWLRDQPSLKQSRDTIVKLLAQYENFLQTTNADESELISRFSDRKKSSEYMAAAYTFGDLAFETLSSIGNGNRFYRLLIV